MKWKHVPDMIAGYSTPGIDENRYRRHAQEPVSIAFGYDEPARKSKYRIDVHVPILGNLFVSHVTYAYGITVYFVLKYE